MENNIVDSKTKKKVLTLYGEELQINDFGGIFIGSEIYVKIRFGFYCQISPTDITK